MTTYERIEQPQWRVFCDVISKVIRDRPVAFEVAGLDLGDQVSSGWLTLSGISYDSAENAVHVFIDADGGQHLDHDIPGPKELYAGIGDVGLSQIVVLDQSDRRHFVRLREVLRLPAPHQASDAPIGRS